jgi:hypothetical protein
LWAIGLNENGSCTTTVQGRIEYVLLFSAR